MIGNITRKVWTTLRVTAGMLTWVAVNGRHGELYHGVPRIVAATDTFETACQKRQIALTNSTSRHAPIPTQPTRNTVNIDVVYHDDPQSSTLRVLTATVGNCSLVIRS